LAALATITQSGAGTANVNVSLAAVTALTMNGTVKLGVDSPFTTGTGGVAVTMNPAVGVTSTFDLNGYAQSFNGLTATSSGNSIIDANSSSARTVTFGLNDQAVNLGGANTAGTPVLGTFTFRNSSSGALSLTKVGAGVMTVNNGATLEHTGPTTVSAGTLSLTRPLAADTFKYAPNFVVYGGATLNLFNAVGRSLTVSGLDLGSGTGITNLGMELGSVTNSDKLVLNGAATLANTVNFQLRPLDGFAAGTYDLITASSGLSSGTKTLGFAITSGAGQGSTYALSSASTGVTLTVADLAAGNVYWKGGVNNNWFGYDSNGSNFTSDSAGNNVIQGLPGASNKVIFNASGQSATSQTVSIDGPVFTGGLVFNAAVGSGPLASIALSAAANSATTINGTLNLTPSVSTDGINVQAGAPASISISAGIILGADQTWTVADVGTTLTVSTSLSGSYGLSKAGSGTLILTVPSLSTYTGATVIKAGIVKAGGTSSTSQFSSLEVQSGATFSTNGFSTQVVASLTGAGTVNNTHASTATNVQVGINQASTTFSGVFANGGVGTLGLYKLGSGVLTLDGASGAHTATGGITVYGGSILFDHSASSLTSMWSSTGSITLNGGGGLSWKANPTVALNATHGALTTASGANFLTIDPNGATDLQIVATGAITATSAGMSLLVTSPVNTELRLGTDYSAVSGSAPRGKIVFTTGDGKIDFIKNAGATTASAAFTAYTDNPATTSGTDTLTPRITQNVSLTGNWTTDKMKIQPSGSGQALTIGTGNTLGLTAGGFIFQGDQDFSITGGSIQGLTSSNSDLVAHVYGSGVLTLASNISNGVGASVFTKSGPGTLNLTGQIQSTGATYMSQGVLNVNAAQSITGNLTVLGGVLNINAAVVGNAASTKLDMAATGSGGKTVTNVSANMTLYATVQGSVAGSSNAYNQTAGTVIITPGANTGTQGVAAGYGYGYFNLTGGTFQDSGSGNRFTASSSGTGVAVINVGVGGSVGNAGTAGFLDNTNGDWLLNYGNASFNVLDGGLIDHTGAANPFGILLNMTVPNVVATLNMAGGEFRTGNQPIRIGNSTTAGNNPGSQVFVNLAKGVLSTGANLSTNLPTTGDVVIYFTGAGGTLKASNNLTSFLPATLQGATLNAVLYGAVDNQTGDNNRGTTAGFRSVAPNFVGGLTVDTAGFDVAIHAPLRAAAGVGVTQADMTLTAGSGYIGAPLVRFSTTGMIPGGTPAQGYAIIDAAAGTVTGIVITNPGTYVAGTVPKLDLIGGGGSGASVAFTGLSTANAAAGLTKVGNGKLTLGAANTYAGGTNVNGGTLALGGTEVLADTGAVTLGGGTLDLTTFNETVGVVTLDSGTITGTTGTLSSSAEFRLRSGAVSGILAGTSGIEKTTTGTVALSAANTFSGTVSVTAGKLQFSADANLGDSSATNIVSVNGGTLAYTPASSLTLSTNHAVEFGPSGATIEVADAAGILTLPSVRASSTGDLTKTGVGTLVLAGSASWNSGANAVTVSAGTLQAGFGTSGVSAINVGSASALNLYNSAAQVLTLGGTAGALTLASGATLGFELGSGTLGTSDKIVVGAGGTVVASGTVTINLLTITGFAPGTFELLSAPSGLTGVTFVLGSAPSGYNYTINQGLDTSVTLDVVAFVPRYWTNAQTGGSWATLTGGTASNWSTDAAGTTDYGATPGAADTVIFSATSLAGGALTTTLDGSYTIDGLQFINATSTATTTFLLSQGTGSGTLTIAPSSTSSGIIVAANAGAVTISAPLVASTTGGAASQTWSVDGTGTSSLTVSGNLTIGAAINTTGAGTLTLSGTNTGSGGLTLGGGTLKLDSSSALGSGALTISALTTVDNSSGAALVLADNAANWNGAFTFTGSNNLSFGTGVATMGQSLTVTATAGVLTVGSLTDGAGSYGLTKAGAGTLTISGAVTIDGTLALSAGILNVGTGGSTMGAITAASGTTLTMSGTNAFTSLVGTSATLTLSGANTISGAVTLNGGTLTASGNNPSIGGALTINSGTATFSGNNGFASASLVTGTLTLSGTNTFATGLTMTGGTLNLNSAGALGGGTLAISAGTLNNSSGSTKVLSNAGAGTVTGSFTFTGSSSLSIGTSSLAVSGNPTITVSANTLTFGGSVTGSSTLTKAGAGNLTFGGGLTHSGSVAVSAGTLTAGASSSYIGSTSITGSGVLVLAGTTNALASLTMASASGTGPKLDLSNASASFNSLVDTTNSTIVGNIVIGSGQELDVTGLVTIGIDGSGATTTKLTVSGAGTFSIGTLAAPTNANFQLGNHSTTSFSNDATLTMSGLTNFYANLGLGTFKVGDPTNSGGSATAGSKLYLAKTSTIVATTITTDTPNSGVTNFVYLGDTANVFNTTNLYLSGNDSTTTSRASGQLSWDAGVTGGSFKLRGLDGADTTAATSVLVAYGASTTAVASTGLMNLAGHISDILATTISIGGNSAASGTGANRTGTLTFDTGSLVATTVNLGSRSGAYQGTNTITGTLNLMASGGTGVVNITTLTAGVNSSSYATTNGATVANLTIGGGTVTIGTFGMGNNSIGGGSTAQTASPVQTTTNISGGSVTITTLNMNVNSSANTGTGNASLANLNISGGTVGITTLSLANTSNAAATATSALSITGGTLTLGANLVYTKTSGTVNSTVTLDGGTLDMSNKTIGSSTALIGTFNLQSGTLKNVNQINNGNGFTKTAGAGTNTLIVDGTNSFSGVFTISSGTVQVGAGSTSGTLGTASITNNSALIFNRSDSATFSNAITGSGSLTQAGSGTSILTGANAYGTTAINAGTLQIGSAGTAGTLGTGAVTIASGATLAFNRNDVGGVTWSNDISGAGTLSMLATSNILTLSGNNTGFTGAIVVSSGALTLSVASSANLGNPSSITIRTNSKLQTTGDVTTSAAISLEGANTGFSPATGTTLTVNGVLTYPAVVGADPRNTGAGTLVLNNSGNTFAANSVWLMSAGTLKLGHAAALNGATLKYNGGTALDNASGADMTLTGVPGLQLTSGFTFIGTKSLSIGGNTSFVQTANSTRTITVTANTLDIGGILATGTDATLTARVDGALTKAGEGTLILSGDSDYSGLTTVSAGVLQVGVGSTAGSLGSGNVTNNATIRFNRSAALTVANTITGSGGIIQSGSGSLALTAENGFSGVTTLESGTLRGGSDTAFGTSALTLNGGTVTSDGSTPRTFANNVTLGGNIALGAATTYTGALTFSGTVGLGGTARTLTINSDVTFGGIVSNGALTKAGNGTLVLSVANAFTGGTSLSAGTVRAGNDAAFGTLATHALALNGGTLTSDGSTARTFANNVTIGGDITLGAASTYTGVLTFSGTVGLGSATRTLAINSAVTFSGVVSNGGLTKAGNGTLTLSAANSYTGTTEIGAGTVAISGSGTLGSGSNLLMSGGTLTLGATSQTVGTVSIIAASTISGGSLTGSSYAASLSSGTATVSANLLANGAIGLSKSGNGTLTLSGANTYAGATTVSGGTLNASAGALAGTSGITVGVGAVVSAADFNSGATITLSDATSSAEFTSAPSSVGAVSNAGTATNALNFSGTGAITVASLTGAGKTRFGGAATITGGISEGDVTVVGLLTGNVYSGAGTISAGSMTGSVGSSVSVTGLLTGVITAGTNTAGSLTSIEVSGGTTTVSGVAAITTLSSGTVNLQGATASIDTLTNGTVNLGTSILSTALTVNSGTFAGLIAGANGSLIKATGGTLILSGANTYGGGTSVNVGTLVIGDLGSLGSGAVTVASGATLDLATFGVSNAITLQAGGSVVNGPSTASVAGLLTGTNSIDTVLTGSGGLSKADGGTLTLSTPNFYEGATVANVAGAVIKAAFLADTSSSLGVGTLSDPSNLVIGAGAKLEFTGDTNTSSSRSFTIAGSGTIAATGTGALNFNSSSKIKLTGATPALTLSATSTTAVNRFESLLDGTDAISTLSIDGVGIWVIGGSANRFKDTATFSIAAGVGVNQGATLGFDSGSLGSSTDSLINVGNNSVLRWSANNVDDISGRLRIGTGDTAKFDIGANDVVFASAPKNAAGAAITAGTIEKKGAGTLQVTFSSPNLDFNVPTGKLSVNGTVGAVNLTSSGTILGGSGTVGAVTTATGSHLSPGNSPGTLNMASLTLAAGTIIDWQVQDALDFTDPLGFDTIHITGNLDVTAVTNSSQRIVIKVASLLGNGNGTTLGAPLNFNNADTPGMMPRTFDFMRVDGAISFAAGKSISDIFSFDLNDFVYTNGGSNNYGLWSVSSYDSGGDTYIRITAVPEPSTYGFGLGALALAAAAIRRRRKNQATKA
jgi:hypothetical protein